MADEAARLLNFPPNKPIRAATALGQVLRDAARNGDTHLPWRTACAEAETLLKLSGRAWGADANGRSLWPTEEEWRTAYKARSLPLTPCTERPA